MQKMSSSHKNIYVTHIRIMSKLYYLAIDGEVRIIVMLTLTHIFTQQIWRAF